MRKLDGEDDGLFERLFRLREPGNVRPLHVGRLGHDRRREPRAQLLDLRVGVVVFAVGAVAPAARPRRPADGPRPARRRDGGARTLLRRLGEVLFELFGAVQVLGKLFPDELFELVVLFVCGRRDRGKSAGGVAPVRRGDHPHFMA